jgi:MFS-type transporter involved in bile tolerance (Atg22 family)
MRTLAKCKTAVSGVVEFISAVFLLVFVVPITVLREDLEDDYDEFKADMKKSIFEHRWQKSQMIYFLKATFAKLRGN